MERVDDALDLLRWGDDAFRTLAMVEGGVKLYSCGDRRCGLQDKETIAYLRSTVLRHGRQTKSIVDRLFIPQATLHEIPICVACSQTSQRLRFLTGIE
jgi:hypothetical protein